MSKRLLGVSAAVLLVGGYCLGMWIVRGPTTDDAGNAKPAKRSAADDPKPDSGPRPKAVALEAEHDFGVTDPRAEGQHIFLVRNDGDAALEFRKGTTTCKCAVAELPERHVQPGGTAQVRLSWIATSDTALFDQRATILTNDPDQPALEFRIKGEIRTFLGANPSQLLFSSIYPGEVQTRATTLFSQVWEEFEVLRVVSSNPHFKWTVTPAEPAALAEVKGKAGYRLEVAAPADLPVGHFKEMLRVSVAPKGHPEQEKTYEIEVAGNRVSWLAISGEGVEPRLGLKIGQLPPGQGFKRRITLMVRDASRKLKVQRVETHPSFLRATITPARTDGSWCNHHHLDIEIPPDAPLCTYLSGEQGEVRVYSDDPKLPVVTMPVAFAVVREGLSQR